MHVEHVLRLDAIIAYEVWIIRLLELLELELSQVCLLLHHVIFYLFLNTVAICGPGMSQDADILCIN